MCVDLVSFRAVVPILPLTDIQRSKKDSVNDNACQEHCETLKRSKGPIINILRITRSGQFEHDKEVGTIATYPDEQ